MVWGKVLQLAQQSSDPCGLTELLAPLPQFLYSNRGLKVSTMILIQLPQLIVLC